jgi:hypothetical protein
MIACDTNVVVQAAVFHAKEPADTKHMPRASADLLRSRTKRSIRVPDIVYGELLMGTVSSRQMRMRELLMQKIPMIESSMASRWAAAKLLKAMRWSKKHSGDCLAYMTSALHGASLFVSWDRDLSGKQKRIRIQAAASVILKSNKITLCLTPEEVMPHHNPKRKSKMTEDQKVMKFCRDYRARAWRRVRAIVGPDMDDQIDYMCAVGRAAAVRNGIKIIPSPV